MVTLAEADIVISILSTVFTLTLLISFTCALFLENHRRNFAILSGIMAGLLLATMIVALSAPFVFPP
ncbi:MAG: hypothetical protein ACTSRS_14565 [Candidatus Helarchaeota archaeon]